MNKTIRGFILLVIGYNILMGIPNCLLGFDWIFLLVFNLFPLGGWIAYSGIQLMIRGD